MGESEEFLRFTHARRFMNLYHVNTFFWLKIVQATLDLVNFLLRLKTQEIDGKIAVD